MTPEHKKITLLALTGILLLASVVLSSWRLMSWNKMGWCGMRIENKEVRNIFYDGPADKTGIRTGDEVIEINGVPIDSVRQIEAVAARTVAGNSIAFRMKPDDHAALFLGSTSFHAVSRDKGEEEFLFSTILPAPFKSIHVTHAPGFEPSGGGDLSCDRFLCVLEKTRRPPYPRILPIVCCGVGILSYSTGRATDFGECSGI